MLQAIERFANFLYGYRNFYFLACILAFLIHIFAAYRGYDAKFGIVLTLLWLAGPGFSVPALRRGARIEQAKQNRGLAPEFVYRFVLSRRYDYFVLIFTIFWFAFLSYVSIAVAIS
jgi:hypothetical protein